MQLVGCPFWPIFHWFLSLSNLPLADQCLQAVRVIFPFTFQEFTPFLGLVLHCSWPVQSSGSSGPLLRLSGLDLGDVTEMPLSSDELLALPAVVGTTDMLLLLLPEIKPKVQYTSVN